MQYIVNNFSVTEPEFNELEKLFGQLAYYAAWQLKKKNAKNNYSDEPEDIVQDLRIAFMKAGSYYKRQTYIESSFKCLRRRVKDFFTRRIICSLKNLWKNRKRHGANRQKFGPYQEAMLEHLVKTYVPELKRPDRNRSLIIDKKFVTYCKTITWNAQKLMGKKITREKGWRTGLTSLSEHTHLI